MLPPVCESCGRDFEPTREGGLVWFPETPQSREWKRRGVVGHPPNAAWYCGEHLSQFRGRDDVVIE